MGVYTDPPGERMAYDLDGSIGFFVDTNGNVTQLSAAQLAALNAEDPRAGLVLPNWGGQGQLGLLFPQARDIDHYFLAAPSNKPPYNYNTVTTTTNSATGNDGAWTVRTSVGLDTSVSSGTVPPVAWLYRQSILAAGYSGVTGIRCALYTNNATSVIWAFHLYGVISAGQTVDRLRFWHPTLDQALSTTPAFMDFGDVQRGTTTTKQFRIRNNSATLTAHTPAVTLGAPTDSSPTQLSEMALSTDGTTWHAGTSGDPLTLADLAPGGTSPVITLRRVKPTTSALGGWAQRLRVAAASWS